MDLIRIRNQNDYGGLAAQAVAIASAPIAAIYIAEGALLARAAWLGISKSTMKNVKRLCGVATFAALCSLKPGDGKLKFEPLNSGRGYVRAREAARKSKDEGIIQNRRKQGKQKVR